MTVTISPLHESMFILRCCVVPQVRSETGFLSGPGGVPFYEIWNDGWDGDSGIKLPEAEAEH